MPRKPMPDLPQTDALHLYRDGRSMASLARKYGVSASWLAARFQEWGEPVRGHAAAQRTRKGMSLAVWRQRAELPP